MEQYAILWLQAYAVIYAICITVLLRARNAPQPFDHSSAFTAAGRVALYLAIFVAGLVAILRHFQP